MILSETPISRGHTYFGDLSTCRAVGANFTIIGGAEEYSGHYSLGVHWLTERLARKVSQDQAP